MADINKVQEEVQILCLKAVMVEKEDAEMLAAAWARQPDSGMAKMLQAFLVFRNALVDVAVRAKLNESTVD